MHPKDTKLCLDVSGLGDNNRRKQRSRGDED